MLEYIWKRFHKEIFMKKIFKFSLLTLLAGLVGGGVLLAHANRSEVKQSKADEVITKYIPVNSTNFYCGDFSKNIGDLISARTDTFHDGMRSYNALDNFINTMAKVGEGETGWVRSKTWIHKGGYVSFLLGGSNNCFVNIFIEPDGEKPGLDYVDHVRNDFYSSRGDAFDDDYRNGVQGAFELSANMALHYYHIPDEYIGRELIVYIKDDATSYYGGVQFGNLRVNQTLDEVARTFAAHKQQIALDAQTSAQNNFSATYMLDTYYASSDFSALETAAAALDNTDDGFEVYGVSNWAYDRAFSTANVDCASIVSDNDAKNWAERMPANKTGNFYLNADTNGVAEDAKYRFISPEFTLSGSGFISAKLGGGTAVMSLINSAGVELATTRIAKAEGTNILNKGFKDASVANVMESGSRLNTMSRTYLDCSAYLGEKVRIILSDDRTGGNWGLAYFDEIVTKYSSVPTFKVDAIQQQWNNSPLYHGVVVDQYVGSAETDFKKAYDFVTRYYGLMRNTENGVSWCTVSQNADVQALLTEYDNLDANVKAIVSASMDYSFGASATSENFWLSEVDLSYTIGQTMNYLPVGYNPSSSFKGFITINNSNVSFVLITAIAIIVTSLVAVSYFLIKKRKHQ